jgi:serine protease Do
VFFAGTGVGVGAGMVLRDGVGLVSPAYAQPQAMSTATAASTEEESIIRAARQVSPAVVSVSREGGSGTGVIVRRDGVIVTNAHVVGNARVVDVNLADGRKLQGQVLDRDRTVDVAVVRIPIKDAPVAPFGDSDNLEVGQSAIAIGNPLGLDRTVTTGVVSAINRSPRGIDLGALIQTDAAISPGNSGGPLIDSRGRVIGINTAILSGSGVNGLGFAIPINLVNDVVGQVLTTGHIARASFLGVQFGDVVPEMAAQFGLPVKEGVIVLGVQPNSPAAQAGVRVQDIITEVNDVKVTQGGDLRRVLRASRPGTTVQLSVLRAPNGTRSTLTARLAEAPNSN